jgi:hypothetical protein
VRFVEIASLRDAKDAERSVDRQQIERYVSSCRGMSCHVTNDTERKDAIAIST